MLNTYCQNVLATELRKTDYDGKSADEAWAWLMLPTETQVVDDTNVMLTPLVAAKVLGPLKAEALAAKVLSVLPTVGPALLESGANLSDPMTAAFLGGLVDGSAILQADVDTLLSIGKRTRTVVIPRRFDTRFYPQLWPHVAENGSEGGPDDQAIHGFPNDISRDEFDVAWKAAGRK